MPPPVSIRRCDALTAFGGVEDTWRRLSAGETALRPTPVLGPGGGDLVPLALLDPMEAAVPPRWWPRLSELVSPVASPEWGRPRTPVFLTSSNFGIDNLCAYSQTPDPAFLAWGLNSSCAERIRGELAWGPNVTVLSHACVSAHLGLHLAAQNLHAGLADRALVVSFDFLSPFVAAGFNALKILNGHFPAPYTPRDPGAVGLGDGAAWAELDLAASPFTLDHIVLGNEFHHFTANRPDGLGFENLLGPIASAADPNSLWIKGHGTGTTEAGRLEATACARRFPGSPLVSWKGGLGHTLGSCALVELALALASFRHGSAPGTVGTSGPTFTPEVATSAVNLARRRSALLLCNAFGGAHGALFLRHEA